MQGHACFPPAPTAHRPALGRCRTKPARIWRHSTRSTYRWSPGSDPQNERKRETLFDNVDAEEPPPSSTAAAGAAGATSTAQAQATNGAGEAAEGASRADGNSGKEKEVWRWPDDDGSELLKGADSGNIAGKGALPASEEEPYRWPEDDRWEEADALSGSLSGDIRTAGGTAGSNGQVPRWDDLPQQAGQQQQQQRGQQDRSAGGGIGSEGSISSGSDADSYFDPDDYGPWGGEATGGGGAAAGQEQRRGRQREGAAGPASSSGSGGGSEGFGTGSGSSWDGGWQAGGWQEATGGWVGPPPAESDAWGASGWEDQSPGYSTASQQQQGQAQRGPWGGSGGDRGPAEAARDWFGALGDMGQQAWGGGGFGSSAGGPADRDIVLLSEDEKDALLPVAPAAEQARVYSGDAVSLVQTTGAALLLTVLLAKTALLAAGTLTSPLWLPWARAFARNANLRRRFAHAGLWRARVLDIEFIAPPRRGFNAAGAGATSRGGGTSSGGGGGTPFGGVGGGAGFAGGRPRALKTVLRVGDGSGAVTELSVDYSFKHETVQAGDAAELLVLSGDARFAGFKALREVYLPESGLWVCAYPFVNRDEFLRISLEVEQERQTEQQQLGREGG